MFSKLAVAVILAATVHESMASHGACCTEANRCGSNYCIPENNGGTGCLSQEYNIYNSYCDITSGAFICDPCCDESKPSRRKLAGRELSHLICSFETCEDNTMNCDGSCSPGYEYTSGCDLDWSQYNSFGDPHIKKWNGEYFDYMGECSMVLVHAPNFRAGLGLDIHIRTKIRYGYSYIQTAAIKIGEEDILQVSGFGDYMIDGVFHAELPSNIAGYKVTKKQQISDKLHSYEIDIDGMIIALGSFKDMVSVDIHHVYPEDFKGSTGLMGEYGTGRFVARDGVTVHEDPNDHGAEWQVRPEEPMLFLSIEDPQYPAQCILPDVSETTRRLAESPVSVEEADAVCANFNEQMRKLCVRDVLATGDLEMAAAGAF